MCYGCMSYTNALKFLQKQLNFLYLTPAKQLELAKNNKPYDPNDNSILNYCAGVENLLLFSEWNRDKIKLYMMFANGLKGKLASIAAIKLLLLYEQWLLTAPLEKKGEYGKLCRDNIGELKRIDSWFIRNEYAGGSIKKDQKILEAELKELDELYNLYDGTETIGYIDMKIKN
jgi:hypothetical protein